MNGLEGTAVARPAEWLRVLVLAGGGRGMASRGVNVREGDPGAARRKELLPACRGEYMMGFGELIDRLTSGTGLDRIEL